MNCVPCIRFCLFVLGCDVMGAGTLYRLELSEKFYQITYFFSVSILGRLVWLEHRKNNTLNRNNKDKNRRSTSKARTFHHR